MAGSDGGLAPLVGRLLVQRGYSSPGEAEAFLFPKLKRLSDPFLLPGMRDAVDRILRAVDGGESVVLYGDYDVDGVTSLALMKTFLGAYGLDASCFLPNRMNEGYGISFEGLERCLSDGNPSLLIALDCGTSSHAELASLAEKGIDALVIDHHESKSPDPPPCVAMVNPKLGDDFHYLCTAGIVFKLGHALVKTRRPEGFDLREYLDLAAVGTVADIVPLEGENRTIVRHGLKRLESSRNAGLAALSKVSGINPPFTGSDVGFRIGPRLNAAGRLDTAQDALDILLTRDPDAAHRIAGALDTRNRERQTVEQRAVRGAEEILEDGFDPARDVSIVLGRDGWHPGVVGIVASRICRKFHRPTFIVGFDGDGVGKGSGRSIPGIHLVEALKECDDLLVKSGGHAMAAGLTIEMDKLDAFRERFEEAVRDRVTDPGILEPKLEIDAEVTFRELDLDLLESYDLLRPFGAGNPEPVFMARAVEVAAPPRILKEKHRKFSLRQHGRRLDAIWFGSAERDLPQLPWDVAFTIDRNAFRGKVSLQLLVKDVRRSGE